MFSRWLFHIALVIAFVAPTNAVIACGSQTEKTSGSSCCTETAASPKHSDQDKHCPCNHEKGDCHCSGCGITCAYSVVAIVQPEQGAAFTSSDITVRQQAFYFADHLPEAVYLPIWHPPQL